MGEGGVGFVVFGLGVLLFVAIVLVVIFIKGSPEPVVLNVSNSSVNRTFFNVTIGSNAESRVSYRVVNMSGSVLFNGFLFPGALEFYKGGVEANTSVNVSVFGDEYYYNESSCNATDEGVLCFVGVKRKALNYSIEFLNGSLLAVEPFGGVIQNPSFCWAWNSSISNVLMNLDEVVVPWDLHSDVDLCYSVGFDVVNRSVFVFGVRPNSLLNNSDGSLLLVVRDKEKDGFRNIGDRSVSRIVIFK